MNTESTHFSALALKASPTATLISAVTIDLVTIVSCYLFAVWTKTFFDPKLFIDLYFALVPIMLLLFAAYAVVDLYGIVGMSPVEELRRVVVTTTLFFIALAGATFLLRGAELYSRQVFLTSWLTICVCVPLVRSWSRRFFCNFSWWGIPVAIIGAGRTGLRIGEDLERLPWLGLRVVAFVDDDALLKNQATEKNILVGIDKGSQRLADAGIERAIIAIPSLKPNELASIIDLLTHRFRHLYIAPALPGIPGLMASTREFAQTMVLEIQANLLRPGALLSKQFLDIAMIIGLGLIAIPFTVLMAVIIPLTSPGPIFYSQERVGREGQIFKAWKFRTMVRNADAVIVQYLLAHPELQIEWELNHKLRNDPRITWVGKLLRKTSLDELPQLWNILKGEMSLVGPRPIVTAEIPKYREFFALYRKVRPGLTGLWQVSGRNDVTYEERVALDAYYVRNWSVWLDLHIIMRTVRVVVLGSGAY